VSNCQLSCHSANRCFGTTILFNNYQQTAFIDIHYRALFICCCAAATSINLSSQCYVMRHYCGAKVTMLQFVMKFCSSCSSFFVFKQYSHPQLFHLVLQYKLASHLQQPRILSLLFPTIINNILESTVAPPSTELHS
jgi:hypothetical protein